MAAAFVLLGVICEDGQLIQGYQGVKGLKNHSIASSLRM
jgi:hypothetical protein